MENKFVYDPNRDEMEDYSQKYFSGNRAKGPNWWFLIVPLALLIIAGVYVYGSKNDGLINPLQPSGGQQVGFGGGPGSVFSSPSSSPTPDPTPTPSPTPTPPMPVTRPFRTPVMYIY